MRGDLLWQGRGIWSRRIWWWAARSQSWQRPTEFIAAGSTSSWPATARGAMSRWSLARGCRARTPTALHGAPAALLCDNGAVFTARPRGGKVLLQLEMERLGVVAKNSRPYHSQGQLDAFVHYYNAIRPHRALGGRTPLQAYQRSGEGTAGLGARP